MIKPPYFIQDLPPGIKVRLGQKGIGRQRIMASDGHLLVILHRPPEPGRREREGLFLWRKPEGAWVAQQGEGMFRLGQHIEEFEKAEAALDTEYSEAQSAEDYFKILEHAAPLLHSAKSLHATLQAAREAVPQDRGLIDARDRAYELERTLDLLYTHTKNALDFHLAQQAEHHASNSTRSVSLANRLNVLAAVFFPLMALSGVFGMNLPSGLEKAPGDLFWMVLVAGVLLGFALCWWVLQGIPARSLFANKPAGAGGKPLPRVIPPPRRGA